jgi:hypothetical protein
MPEAHHHFDDEPTSKRICREPVVIESRDCKRTITCDDEPTKAYLPRTVVIESRDKRTITCDDEPTSKRICREPVVIESRDCKRTITCDDEPTSKRICREPVVIESRDCKRTITL